MQETTQEHFNIFKEESKKWIDWFELNDWRVVFKHEKLDGSLAECWYKSVGRVASLILNTEWADQEPVCEETVRKTAFHEVVELWLADMSNIAASRAFSEDDLMKTTHRLVRLLENKLWKPEQSNEPGSSGHV